MTGKPEFFFLHPHSVRSYGGLEEDVDYARSSLGEANVGFNGNMIEDGHIVIPRYRAIPFGFELESEINSRGARLINSYRQHRNIADQSVWWKDLYEENLTPIRYTIEDYMSIPEGEYFVKGETNSLKNNWFKACYSPDKKSLMDVVRYNLLDSSTGNQAVYIQPFQKYRQIDESVDGRPVFNERRAFVYQGQVLTHAPYWSSFDASWTVEALKPGMFDSALERAVKLTDYLADFYVIDLAEKEDGEWLVVELNDGSMSGRSGNTSQQVFSKIFTT